MGSCALQRARSGALPSGATLHVAMGSPWAAGDSPFSARRRSLEPTRPARAVESGRCSGAAFQAQRRPHPYPQRGRRLRENANSTCSGDVAPPVASEKRRAEAAGLGRNKRPKRALAVGDGRLPGAGREYCCCLPNYSPGAQFADEREKPPIRRALFRFRRQRGRQNSRRPTKGPPFAPAVSTGYFADFPTAPAFSSERAT